MTFARGVIKGSGTVTVTHVSDDIKNGWPGFDGHGPSGDSFWGYDDQIVTYPRIRKVDIG